MRAYRKGMEVFAASDNSDEMIAEAKEYCVRQGITSDDAKITRTNDGIRVILKRDFLFSATAQKEN